jgi:arabinose-5-phosphate isomerase
MAQRLRSYTTRYQGLKVAVTFSGDLLKLGRDVLAEESQSLLDSAQKLDANFLHSVDALLKCKGRIVVSGVGKSGHVGRKIAATLASTGSPAFFVHAGEAGHGDLGMITAGDILLALSNSGETDELVNFISFAKRFHVKVIGLTGKPNSTIAKFSDWHIDSGVKQEACPLGVAPTSSTTVQLALGDALAMAVVAARGFTTEDFARTHPRGALGRKYYLRVRDVMQPISAIPNRQSSALLTEVIPEMAIGRMGAILLLSGGDKLSGIFTDSDLRRLIVQSKGRFDEKLSQPISNFMTSRPLTIDAQTLASDALRIFEEKRISRIVCIENQKVVGLLGWHNLLEHKVT